MELTHAEENPKILTDPFEVRIAIQAMKGLTVLLSVFQIPDAERIVRQVIELSQTPNLAKGLVSAYVQFCKEQNCILSSGCIELLIDAMLKIPYYPSATILNEKLLTLKSYISRSPAVMLKLCESWQQFVLSCVMSVECPSYDRLMKVTLSLYAEFSKICNRTTRQTCFNILDMESHTLTQSYPVIASLEAFKTNKSVCDAVVEALTALIHRKEYETAMELWAHLLYISSSFTWKNGLETWNHLVSWISVFTTCFNDEGETPKLAALHAWRSVIFSYQYSLSFKTSAVLESEAEEYQLKSKFHVLAHPLRSFSGEIDEPLMSAYETLFTRLYYSLYRFLSKNPVSGGDREGWVIDWVVELVKDLCFGTTTSSIQVEVGYSILTQLFSTTPQKSKQTFKMTAKDCFLGSSGEDLQLPTLNPGWVCIRRSDFVQLLTKALSYDYADSLARLKLMISFLDASKNGQSALDSYRYIEDLPVLSKAIFGSSLGKNRIQFADLRESMLEMVQKFGFQAMLTPSADIPCFFILALQYYSVEETNDAALNSTCVDLLHFTLEHDHSSYISVCQMLIQLNSGRFADDVAGSLLESASYVHTLGSFESWKTIKEYLSPELFIDLLVRLVELGCELKKDPKLVFEEQVRFWKSIGLFEYGMPYLVVLFHRLRTTPATHPISTFWLAFLIDFEAEPEVSTAALLLETLGLGNSCASEEYALVHSYVAKVSAAAPESKPVQDLTVALQNLQSLLDMRKDQVSAFVSSLTPPLQILPPEEPSAVDLPEEEPLVSETEPEKEPQGQENETEAEPPVSENVPAEKPSAPENEPTAVEQPSSLDNSQIATEPETLVISSGDEEQEPHTAPEVQQPDSQPPSQAEKRPVLDSSDRSSQAVPPPQRNFSSNGQTHSTSETNLAQLQSTPQPQVFPDPYNPLRPATFDPDQSVYSDAGRLAPYPPPFPYPGYPFYPPMMRPPPMGQPDANPYSMYYWNPYQMPPPPAGPGPILDQSDPEDWVHLEGLVTRLNQTHANGVVELDETKKRKLEDDLFSLLTCLKKRR
ncbi:hypothetical protein OGAPHI_003853 [Ogataea philodendri]|uniref:Telomere-associated protein Rif1 N-terminal domain-containing protein n=1 Tax=Ogataea philodendri TaxID=1378263 RepID=A0A9P8P602_9ASCO|nr:uncharacterized protein OGAPHI_003853 [Ogataea philodendri]KAH3665665.1 hypothetical protein OGAPHI_003853 [Ogataea philodendri]